MYESGENYLETIFMLKEKKGQVRSIDVAREMNFSKPSVSRAIGILKDTGYIQVDESGYIELTDMGMDKAAKVYERHKFLTHFLLKIAKVSPELAEENACKMEHILSDEVYQGLKNFMKDYKG